MYVCMYMCVCVCVYMYVLIYVWQMFRIGSRLCGHPILFIISFLVIGMCYLSFITLQFPETFSFTSILIFFHQRLVLPSRFFLQAFPAHWHVLETTACVTLSNINLNIHRSWHINQFRYWHGVIFQKTWIFMNTSFRSSDLETVALLRDLHNLKHTAYRKQITQVQNSFYQ
jgi:hypothetical protein